MHTNSKMKIKLIIKALLCYPLRSNAKYHKRFLANGVARTDTRHRSGKQSSGRLQSENGYNTIYYIANK